MSQTTQKSPGARLAKLTPNQLGLIGGVAVALAVAVLALIRAGSVAITHDEASTFNNYLSGKFFWVFAYDANNHVLYTLMSFFAVRAFGASELIIRLPALLAAAVYLGVTALICRKLFTSYWIALGIGLMSLNPLVVDYMSLARGYGMALALYTGALYVALGCVDGVTKQTPFSQGNMLRAVCMSLLMSLAVCANLTFVLPCAALAVVLVALLTGGNIGQAQVRTFLTRLLLPGAAVGFTILWPFLLQARPGQFYVGETSIWQSLVGMTSAALFYRATAQRAMAMPPVGPLLSLAQRAVAAIVLMGLAAVLMDVIFVVRQRLAKRSLSAAELRLGLIGGTLAGCVALAVLLHLGGMKYPVPRTGIYYYPLVALTVLMWVVVSRESKAGPVRQWAVLGTAIAVLLAFSLQLQTGFTYSNRYDAGDRTAFELIERDRPPAGAQPVRVGGSWYYDAGLNFYRTMHNATWMAPVENPVEATSAGHDYFLFHPGDYPGLDDPHLHPELHVIWTDPISGVKLARVIGPASQPATGK